MATKLGRWAGFALPCLQDMEIFAVIPQLKGLVSRSGTCASYNARQISSVVKESIRSIKWDTWPILPLFDNLMWCYLLWLLYIPFYYLPSSVSRQDESNFAWWLATQAGKMELSCPLGTTHHVPKENFPESHTVVGCRWSFLFRLFTHTAWICVMSTFP